jgi:hypothetical protein
LCHADSTSWEVWIIILSFPHNRSCWGITVSSEKGKYIVLKESHAIKRFLTHTMNIYLVGTQSKKGKRNMRTTRLISKDYWLAAKSSPDINEWSINEALLFGYIPS